MDNLTREANATYYYLIPKYGQYKPLAAVFSELPMPPPPKLHVNKRVINGINCYVNVRDFRAIQQCRHFFEVRCIVYEPHRRKELSHIIADYGDLEAVTRRGWQKINDYLNRR